MEKSINSLCLCKKYLSKYESDIYTIVPCGHMIHSKCIKKYITSNKCYNCQTIIQNIISFTNIKKMIKQKNYKYYQNYIDMNAVRNRSNYGIINYDKLLVRTPTNILAITKSFTIRNFDSAVMLSRFLLEKLKIDIRVIDEHKILLNRSKVIIANHSNLLDSLVIFNKFKCGFLASAVIKDIWYAKNTVKHIPLVKLNRDDKQKTVDKIKDFLSEHKSLCLFPEGMITHPKTLIKFRSGAFYTGYPVQPIIVTYNPFIYSEDYTNFLCKLLSQNKINVTIQVLDPVYPPFTPEKIEHVRINMAKAGNFALSNVSNRDIKDTKTKFSKTE